MFRSSSPTGARASASSPLPYEVTALIERLKLQAHPEGGWFKETYRAAARTQTAKGERHLATLIYYLLPRGVVSRVHRVAWDEIWIFQGGGVLDLQTHTDSGISVEKLGITANSSPQIVIPAGAWFNACVAEGEFVLAACLVTPGFEFADLEMR